MCALVFSREEKKKPKGGEKKLKGWGKMVLMGYVHQVVSEIQEGEEVHCRASGRL